MCGLYASYIDHHTLTVHSSRGIGLLGQAHICRIALLGSNNGNYLQLQPGTPTPKPPVHGIPRSGSTTPR